MECENLGLGIVSVRSFTESFVVLVWFIWFSTFCNLGLVVVCDFFLISWGVAVFNVVFKILKLVFRILKIMDYNCWNFRPVCRFV